MLLRKTFFNLLLNTAGKLFSLSANNRKFLQDLTPLDHKAVFKCISRWLWLRKLRVRVVSRNDEEMSFKP